MLFLLVFLSTLFSCNSQETSKKHDKDEMKKPQGKVIVNRKYDENGNLVEFDSTYTSYYSNFSSDTVILDSLMKEFPPFFDKEFFNSEYLFNSFLQNDSSINNHFFNDDYFEKQFFDQNEEMLKMIQKMDSIKKSFFEEQWK